MATASGQASNPFSTRRAVLSHEVLPEEEVGGQQGTAHHEGQAGSQRPLRLHQVALGTQTQPEDLQGCEQKQCKVKGGHVQGKAEGLVDQREQCDQEEVEV